MSEIIKCSECGKIMAIKDSNTYDGEYWEGYECLNCSNVELLCFDVSLYKEEKKEELIIYSTRKYF